jgi:Family of unknown function (DUF5706)
MRRENHDCLDDLWHTLHGVQEWVRFADAKAGAVLAVDGVLIAQFAPHVDDKGANAVSLGFVVGAMVLAAFSALSALFAVYPRISMVKPVSMLYFDHVSRRKDALDYHYAAMHLLRDSDLLARGLTDQIWAFSRQARRKYVHVTWAVVLLGASACLGLPAVMLI